MDDDSYSSFFQSKWMGHKSSPVTSCSRPLFFRSSAWNKGDGGGVDWFIQFAKLLRMRFKSSLLASFAPRWSWNKKKKNIGWRETNASRRGHTSAKKPASSSGELLSIFVLKLGIRRKSSFKAKWLRSQLSHSHKLASVLNKWISLRTCTSMSWSRHCQDLQTVHWLGNHLPCTVSASQIALSAH